MPAAPTVHAAGVLVWRAAGDEVRVLLVRRPEYNDVSLPKGKVDPGELLPTTARRELFEETGVDAALGAPIGKVRYTVGGRPKEVHYWAAEVDGHEVEAARFTPNSEISAVEWAPIAKAKKLVSYPYDEEMIGTLQQRLRRSAARTFSIVIARHAKAVPPAGWDGPDATRPLLHRGTGQAERIAPAIAAFRPVKIVSSPAVRCAATMEPLAALTGLPVREALGISQDALADGRATPERQIRKRIAKGENVVLCSHGPVIPLLVDAIRKATGAVSTTELQRAGELATGDFAVFHITLDGERAKLVEVEVHSPG